MIISSLLVMLGWFFDIPVLKSILPQFVSMKFTTALCFLLSGIILYYLCRNYHQESQTNDLVIIFVGFLVILVMASFLLSVFFNITTGLENLFVIEPKDTVKTPVPGRPALAVMINFVLVAASGLLSLYKRTANFIIISVLGIIVALTGLVAIIGYVADAPKLYGHFSNISSAVALHSAVLFTLIGISLAVIGRHLMIKNQHQ